MSGNKQYGLILNPAKQKAQLRPVPRPTRPNIFDEDDDDEDDALDSEAPSSQNTDKGTRVLGPASGPPAATSSRKSAFEAQLKRKTLEDIQKAMAEDESVFQYDEIYDDMKAKDVKSKDVDKKDRKPKYVDKLLKTAEDRKKEQERRLERQIQKEREAEGDQFADKEAFITSAYKAKLQEMKEAEEKERMEKELEDRMDVRKQTNMTGFYKNLLKQAVGEEIGSSNKIEEPTTQIKKTDASKKQLRQRNIAPDSDSEGEHGEERSARRSSSPAPRENSQINARSPLSDRSQSRSPRRETQSVKDKSSKDEIHHRSTKQRSRSPDSKRRRDTSRSRERDHRSRRDRERSKSPRRKDESRKERRRDDREDRRHRDSKRSRDGRDNVPSKPQKEEEKAESTEDGKENEATEVKPKLTRREIIQKLFSKRTIEETFEEARERYLQRKELRKIHGLKVYEKLPA